MLPILNPRGEILEGNASFTGKFFDGFVKKNLKIMYKLKKIKKLNFNYKRTYS